MVTVSVLLPTWQRPDLLVQRALPSALGQTVADIEVIVVSDGPDPATRRAMASISDPRVRYQEIARPTYPDEGEERWRILASWAINRAIEDARGEWLTILADDDELTSDHCEVLLDLAARRNSVVAYGVTLVLQASGLWSRLGDWPPRVGEISSGAPIWRADLNLRYDPAGAMARCTPADWFFWDTMLDVDWAYTPTSVYRYYPANRVPHPTTPPPKEEHWGRPR
jgi:O-antigen biosynthesis protein